MRAAANEHHHPPDPSDTVGQILSAVCAVHCAATPVVLAMAPALASFFGGFHPVLLVLVTAVGAWAFVPGYRRHGRAEVLIEAGVGVTLLAVAALVFSDRLALDIGLSVMGASVMMVAHWRNRTLQRACCRH